MNTFIPKMMLKACEMAAYNAFISKMQVDLGGRMFRTQLFATLKNNIYYSFRRKKDVSTLYYFF